MALAGLVLVCVGTCGCVGGDSFDDTTSLKTLKELGVEFDGQITEGELSALAKYNYASQKEIQDNRNYIETMSPMAEKSIVVLVDDNQNGNPDLLFMEQANAQLVKDLKKDGKAYNGQVVISGLDNDYDYPKLQISYPKDGVYLANNIEEGNLHDLVPDDRDFSDSMQYVSNSDKTVYEGIVYDVGDKIKGFAQSGKIKVLTIAGAIQDVELSKIYVRK